jgi:hypothetical protein
MTYQGVDPRPLFETVEMVFELAPMSRAALRRALEAESKADVEDAYLAGAGAEPAVSVASSRCIRIPKGRVVCVRESSGVWAYTTTTVSPSARSKASRAWSSISDGDHCGPGTQLLPGNQFEAGAH